LSEQIFRVDKGAHQVPGQGREHLGRAWGSAPLVDRSHQAGAKRDDFLVDKSAAKKTRKKTRRKK
jgi:hypothetical protein